MLVTIKYFGLIAEITKTAEEQLEVSEISINELLEQLYSKYTPLQETKFQIAQNQELVDVNTKISGHDIALLPPFAGG